jgi:hypothetical protein
MTQSDLRKIEDFYNALNEQQKQRVEAKIKTLLKENYDTLPPTNVDLMRWQVASDIYRVLNG